MKSSSTVRKHRTAAERESILRAYRQSGCSQREFAAKAGIGYSTLTLWLRQAAGKTHPAATRKPALVAVPNLFSGLSAPAFRLQFPDGITVEVVSGFRPEELGNVLRQLRSL